MNLSDQMSHATSINTAEPETFLFNCSILGPDVERLFPVRILPGRTIGELKNLIKEVGGIQVVASRLDIWRVSGQRTDPHTIINSL